MHLRYYHKISLQDYLAFLLVSGIEVWKLGKRPTLYCGIVQVETLIAIPRVFVFWLMLALFYKSKFSLWTAHTVHF